MLIPLTLVALLASVAPPPATRVAEAEALMADLEYAQAAELLDEALADERLTDDGRVRAHMMAGVANRILRRDVDAQLHFERALKLDATASLPSGQPPKIVTFFEMIRTRHAESLGPTPVEQANAPIVAASPPPEPASEEAAVAEIDAREGTTSLGFYAAATLGGVGAIAAVAWLMTTVAAGAIEVLLRVGSISVATREPLRPVGRGVVVAAVALGGVSALALVSGAATWAITATVEGE